jgi:hypothetical protein
MFLFHSFGILFPLVFHPMIPSCAYTRLAFYWNCVSFFLFLTAAAAVFFSDSVSSLLFRFEAMVAPGNSLKEQGARSTEREMMRFERASL